MDYLKFKEITQKYREGDTSEDIIDYIKNFYKERKDVWLDDINNPLIQARFNWLKNKITKYQYNISILDVGSWSGTIANSIYSLGYTNIDCLEICTAACKLGKETFPHLNFLNEDVYTFKTEKKYDIIILSEILEHLHNPINIIKKYQNMLTDNGILLITIPTPQSVFKTNSSEHITFLKLEELEKFGLVDYIRYDDVWSWYAVSISPESKYKKHLTWRFHLLGFPNYKIGWEKAPNNPFNTKLIYLAKMLKDLGHEVLCYGVEGSDTEYIDKFIPVVSNTTFEKLYGNRDYNALDNLQEEAGPAFDEFNRNSIKEIEKNIQNPGKEFLINFMGYIYKPITDHFKDKLISLEPGIGHNGSYLQNRVFESYAWQNHVYGKECQPRQSYFPNMYDTVIPAYFDPKDYPFVNNKSDYYVYIGRIIWGKGVSVAIDLTRELNSKLIVIGGGNIKDVLPPDYNQNLDHVIQTGVLSKKDKVKYLANAKGLIYFSLYVEPFGHAPIEAMLCGTPVITSDFGAFTETVINGITGYRVNTFNELYWAAKYLEKLNPTKIREYAINNYGLDNIKYKYQEYFTKLYNLYTGNGWYYLDKTFPINLNHLTKFIPC